MKKYDVIIAGASFAGLGLASRIKGKVLLIDKYEIGSHQISACATLVKTLKDLNCDEAILQSFNTIALHIQNNEHTFPLVDEFCTFDYQKFCSLFNEQNQADFVQATVTGFDNNIIKTTIGNFTSDLFVDATGPNCAIAESKQSGYITPEMISHGIETEIDYKKDEKIRFFLDQKNYKNSIAWLFPIDKQSRFGIASYFLDNTLAQKLKYFVETKHSLKIDKVHGGSFSHKLNKPVIDDIFIVGSAAGHTLPLTGEGIRQTIKYSLFCGDVIQKVLDKKITKKQALEEYENFATKKKKQYDLLLKLQNRLMSSPSWQINLVSKLLTYKPIFNFVWKWYEKL